MLVSKIDTLINHCFFVTLTIKTMKKYCFIIILFFSAAVFGQNGDQNRALHDIRNMELLGQRKQAKTAIDSFLSDPANANVAQAYFYKGQIYNLVSKDTSVEITTVDPAESLKLKTEALEAFKKYQLMDKQGGLLIEEDYQPYLDLYHGFFDIGLKLFQKKDFSMAHEAFKNALAVEDLVSSKGYVYRGFKFPALDGPLILNIAVSANMAKGEASAVPYFRRLADANVSGEQFLGVYQFLADYYQKTNDDANLSAVLKKATTLYPQNEYWGDVEIKSVVKTGNNAAIVAKYEELVQRYPTKYAYAYNMSVVLYNLVYPADNRPPAVDLRDKLTRTLKLAIPLDQSVDAKMLMARHLYSYAYDLQDASQAIKGDEPKDVEKRKELKDQSIKIVDECIPYAEGAAAYFAALPSLTSPQKANYKEMLDILISFYLIKGDPKKASEFEKKKAELDKM